MSFTPLAFTGISKFSSDFQTILTRSQDIASLPLKALQNDQQTCLQQQAAWIPIEAAVSKLASSIQKLGDIGAGQALAVTSSDYATVGVTQTGSAAAGSYVIGNITSLARATTATMVTGLATADKTKVNASSNELELVINGKETPLTLTDATNNLNGVRDAINAANLGVQASIISTGSANYLSITADAGGETTIELRTVSGSSASNLLETTIEGKNAEFEVNGREVTRTSNTVTDVLPGLSLTLRNTTDTGEQVTIAVSRDRDQLASALDDLASSYNAAVDALDTQVGEKAGMLSGDSMVRELQQQLRTMVSYASGGAIGNLTDLGIEFDRQGVMSFNTDTVSSLSNSQLQAAFEFLGSETTGFGAFSGKLDQYSDPVLGLIAMQQSAYDTTNQRLTNQISTMTDRIQAMQLTLSAQLQAADALLAKLDGQQNLLTATIDSLNAVTYANLNSKSSS